MGQSPLDTKLLTRMGFAGLVLAGVGIALFILVWDIMGQAGVSDVPRLFAAICLPPAGIAALMGFYLLVIGTPKEKS